MDYTENTASGSWTVTHHAGATLEITGLVSESSGVATTGSKGNTNHAQTSNAAGTTQTTGSITPAAGSIVYTAYCDDGGTSTAGTINLSFLVSSDSTAWNGANQRGGMAHLDNVANSAINPTWTVPTANNRQAMIAEFIAAAGGLPPGLGPAAQMEMYTMAAISSLQR